MIVTGNCENVTIQVTVQEREGGGETDREIERDRDRETGRQRDKIILYYTGIKI